MFVLVLLAVALVCSEVAIGVEGSGCPAYNYGSKEQCETYCIS